MNNKSLLWITLIFICIVLALIIFLINVNESNNYKYNGTTDYVQTQDKIMYDMVDNVMSIPENGSAEKAYLAELIAISNANIEIAKQYLSNNSYNLALNSLANNIIQTQSDEVKYMNQLYNDVYIIDIEKELKYLNSFNNAMCTNTTSVLYKSIDIAFASAIKENYKIILDLSNNIISCNCSDNIRYFAQDLINKHDGTINLIEQILNA